MIQTQSNTKKSKLKKAWDIFTSIIVIVAIVLAILFVGFRVIGFEVYTVVSGSMEPEIPVGSLVYVKEIDPFKLKSRDVISYLVSENTIVTHRVTEIVPDPEDPSVIRFRTKGDANDVEDAGLVHGKNIIGKVRFHIPLLGYVAHFLHTPLGRYIALVGGSILLLVTFVPDIVRYILPVKPEELE